MSVSIKQEILDMQFQLHKKLLQLRSIERLVSSDIFEEYYEKASESRKKEAQIIINNIDSEKLIQWITNEKIHHSKDIALKSVRELRTIASDLGIYGYSWLSRSSLLMEIAKYNGNNHK